MKINNNIINGKQYPYGFRSWLNKVLLLFKEIGSFENAMPVRDVGVLDPDAWLEFFMDGYTPYDAFREDLDNS